jgi:putative heme iron utilization protein
MSNATVTTASSFLNSLGINTNAGSYVDAYTNSSLIISSLDYLGISHVRDSYSATGHANAVIDALANAGVSFDFRVSYVLPASGSSGLASYVTALAEFTTEHPGAVLSIEGINEANLNSFSYNGMTSLEGAAAFQEALYTAVKANGVLSDVTVVNFSIGNQTDALNATVGDMSAYSDAANAHVYVHTGALADGQIEQDLALAEDISTNDPVIVTETGYTTLESTVGIGVNEDAQAKLVLSNLLLAYEDGSSATYLYELFDSPSSASRGDKEAYFGLFNSDGTPKEAAVAVHNLTTILSHGDDGSAHTGTDLNFTLSNAPSNTHTMLMNKSGAVSDLVVWADTIVWDSSTQTEITTPATTVTVNLGQVESVVYVYDPLQGTSPIAVYYNTSTIQISLSDHPLVIEVGATAAAGESTTTVDYDLTMTSADFVAQMDTLVSSAGLEKVTLTDSHVLAVSSSETMKYVIANYGDLLSKISGGYSFSISWSGTGWTQEQDFDASGTLTETTVWGVSSSGAITSKSITLADGRVDYYHYGVTGQAYTSDHTAYDASGKVTLVERFHADGSYQYKAVYNTDGSKVYDYYSSTGVLSTEVSVTSASTVTTTYDTATGYKLRVYTSNSDGSADNKVYTNGVLMKDNVLNKDGSSEVYVYNITGQSYTTTHQVSDASGKVTLIERFHADGSYQYKVVYNADGSKVYDYYSSTGAHSSEISVTSTATTTTTYDTTTGYKLKVYTANADGSADNKAYTNGVLMKDNVLNKDGSSEVYVYNITGQAYTSTHQVADASGKVTLIERFHADGSYQYTALYNADGSKIYDYYTTAGARSSEISVTSTATTTTTYDTTTGYKVKVYTANVDGSADNKAYTNGVLMKDNVLNKDGSSEVYVYNITGQSYTSTHQVGDASGKVTLIERFHADGSYQYKVVYNADGSKVYDYYTTAGAHSSEVSVTSTATMTTTYDTTTGYKVSVYTANVDGSADNKTYVNDVLTKDSLLHKDGSSEVYVYNITGQSYTSTHQASDASGNVTLVERFHSDGSYDYKAAYNSDGSKLFDYYTSAGKLSTEVSVTSTGTTTDTYDTASGNKLTEYTANVDGSAENKTYTSGVLTKDSLLHKDGSTDVYAYQITGQSYTSTHQANDASGSVTLVERFHSDGSYDYLEKHNTDGSKEISNYSSAGAILNHTLVKTDGSTVVDYYSQDGTGDIRTDTANASGSLTMREYTHTSGAHEVYAYADNLTLTGGTGNDTFYFRSTNGGTVTYQGGNDTVYSFNNGASTASTDKISVSSSLAASFSDLHMAQQGSDVLITLDSHDTILIKASTVASLHSEYFVFT